MWKEVLRVRFPKRDPIKNYFPLPNEVYALGLKPTELSIYAYLLRIEDRKTFECYASYKTIGKAVGVSPNTVSKYVSSLEERGLITTEHTTVTLRDGTKRNGTLYRPERRETCCNSNIVGNGVYSCWYGAISSERYEPNGLYQNDA